MNRRRFLQASILGALGLYPMRRGAEGKAGALEMFPPSFEPQTEEEKTMMAFADTVIPGSDSDPEGSAGALEAGAMQVMFDKSYAVHQFIPTISMLLNREANRMHVKKFYELDLEQRTEVLERVENQLPYINMIAKLVKGCFYAGFVNDVGYRYMGYPGPNLGYLGKGFSFGRKMSEELTEDGSLP